MAENSSHHEKALLLRVADGDEGAFRRLYDLYEPLIYGTALSYLKSPDWARDLVQDVFLTVWTQRARLAAVEKPEAFLFIIQIINKDTTLNAMNTWNSA